VPGGVPLAAQPDEADQGVVARGFGGSLPASPGEAPRSLRDAPGVRGLSPGGRAGRTPRASATSVRSRRAIPGRARHQPVGVTSARPGESLVGHGPQAPSCRWWPRQGRAASSSLGGGSSPSSGDARQAGGARGRRPTPGRSALGADHRGEDEPERGLLVRKAGEGRGAPALSTLCSARGWSTPGCAGAPKACGGRRAPLGPPLALVAAPVAEDAGFSASGPRPLWSLVLASLVVPAD
jgi:hypothetical protein